MVVAIDEKAKNETVFSEQETLHGDIIELRAKSQVTIPKKLLKQVGMEEGDNFEAVAVNGEIRLIPVAIYPKKLVERWQNEFEQARQDYVDGKVKTYDSVSEAIDELEDEDGLKNTVDGQS